MKTVAAVLSCWLLVATALNAQSKSVGRNDGIMVRISEIEIHSQYLEEYQSILKEEAGASVRLEPGVIAIFPMNGQANPTDIRILEIYTNREAYEAHLKTPHFQRYKTTTLKMVKSLKLMDMIAIDADTMAAIFSKMTTNKGTTHADSK